MFLLLLFLLLLGYICRETGWPSKALRKYPVRLGISKVLLLPLDRLFSLDRWKPYKVVCSTQCASLVVVLRWISHQNILYSVGIQTGSHSVAVLLYIYIILFSSILASTLLGCDSRLIPIYGEHSLLSPFRFHIGIIIDCLHYIGLLNILSTAVLHRLLLLLLLSRCLFRLFRVPFRSLLISVTPQLLIVVFLARAPECLVPKSCCLSCTHLDLVTIQSNLPISVWYDVCYYLALCIFNCLITCLHASLADWYCSLFCGVGSFSHFLYNCFFNFVACLVFSFHHAVAFFCCPPDFCCPTIFSAVPWLISFKSIHYFSAELNLLESYASL